VACLLRNTIGTRKLMWSPFAPRFFCFFSVTCSVYRQLQSSSRRMTCGIIADLNCCGIHCRLILIIYSGIVCHLRRSSPTSFIVSQDNLRHHRRLDLYSGIGCHLNRRLVGRLAAVLCQLESSSRRTTCGIIAGLDRCLIGQLAASLPTSIVLLYDDLRHGHCRLQSLSCRITCGVIAVLITMCTSVRLQSWS
jgi:hypothetical protein